MKKLIVFLLTCVLAFGAAGCGGREEKDAEGRDIVRIFMINGNYLEGAKKDSAWQHIEETTNTSLRLEGAVNNADYYTRLSPMLNSGKNMPDVFFSVPTATDNAYFNWADQRTGILYNIDELLLGRETEFPYLSKVLYSEKYGNIRYDGAHTLIPAPDGTSGWSVYYRGDWLINIGYYDTDEAGNKVARPPVTIEEFEDVCRKFTTMNPDGDDKKNTWAMAPQNSVHCLSPLYHAFGTPTDWDIDAEGDVSFMYADERFRSFLSWFNGLYDEGLIYPQFYTLNESGERKMFEEGKTGIVITNGGEACLWVAKPCEEVFGYGTVVCGPAPVGTSNLGQEGAGGFSDWGGWWGGFSITKACTNPDAVLRLFEYLLSPEGGMTKNFGLEGLHYDLADGKVAANVENRKKEPEAAFKTVTDIDGNSVLKGRYRFSGILGGYPIDWDYFDETGTFRCFIDNASLDIRYAPLMDAQDALRKEHSTNLLNFTDIPTVILRKQLIIQDKLATYALNAIAGKKNLTSDWTKVLEECDSQGMKEVKAALREGATDAGILDRLQRSIEA